MSEEPDSSGRGLSKGLLAIMAVACALGVANNYYCQPLLVAIARSLGATDRAIGSIPTLTQVGMGIGILLLAPLGDKMERRRLIVSTSLLCAASLVVIASARNLVMLQFASLAVGLTSVVSTLVLPFAVSLSRPKERGRTVGTIVSAMLIGILLSRTISGIVGEHLGWRVTFTAAAVLMIFMAGILRVLLPTSVPSVELPYRRLIVSMGDLVRQHRILREATINGVLLYAALSAFWASLVFFVESPAYGYGPAVVGLFGFVGAASATVAPIAGRLTDRHDPRRLVGIAAWMMLLSWVVLGIFGATLAGLIVGIIGLDLAAQAATISNQATVYSLPEAVHSRAYTVYRAAYSLGGALGAFLGVWGWSVAKWTGVCAVGGGFVAVALGLHAYAQRRASVEASSMLRAELKM